MLNIKNKKAVVIGGGQIAYRKVMGLLEAGTTVRVISPESTSAIQALHDQHRIVLEKRMFINADILDAFVLIIATNNKKLNHYIASIAGKHQLINVIDDPKRCTFHLPAKLTRGDLTIAVATGGASPILAKTIRDELAKTFDKSYIDYLEFLSTVRKRILSTNQLDNEIKYQLLLEVTKDGYKQSKNKRHNFLEMLDKECLNFQNLNV